MRWPWSKRATVPPAVVLELGASDWLIAKVPPGTTAPESARLRQSLAALREQDGPTVVLPDGVTLEVVRRRPREAGNAP